MDFIVHQIPVLLSNEKLSLVVIDSMSALFRGEQNSKSSAMERSSRLFTAAQKMKKLSQQYRIPFVVINQVTSYFQNPSAHCNPAMLPQNVVPALGLTWSNCVNTRYLLARYEKSNQNSNLEKSKRYGKELPDIEKH